MLLTALVATAWTGASLQHPSDVLELPGGAMWVDQCFFSCPVGLRP